MADIVPKEKKRLRACLLCGLIKTQAQFRTNGCDNCEELLQLTGSAKNVSERTSSTFDGVIAMMKPDASWVARWQRIDKFAKGMYAIRVAGVLPEEVQVDLAELNIKYRPRDGSDYILPGM